MAVPENDLVCSADDSALVRPQMAAFRGSFPETGHAGMVPEADFVLS
jgi:hypothetical protein